MATEIVVVVEQQDPFVLAGLLLIEVGRCEAADAGSDDDQVVLFVEVGVAGGAFPIPGQGGATSYEPSWLPRSPVSAGG